MIDRVVKIHHLNKTLINHMKKDISFIASHVHQKVKIDVEKISGPIAVVKFISTRLVVLENVKAGIRGTSCSWY